MKRAALLGRCKSLGLAPLELLRCLLGGLLAFPAMANHRQIEAKLSADEMDSLLRLVVGNTLEDGWLEVHELGRERLAALEAA